MSCTAESDAIITKLKGDGNFLFLSRTESNYFSTPLLFSLNNGVEVVISGPGIISFSPPSPSHKHIILSSGIHGNETAPIEICDDLVQRILTQEITPAHRVLFIFGNLPAMDIAQRFVEENMNRLFCGVHSKEKGCINPERQRAKALEQAVSAFYAESQPSDIKLHYDLHTAIRKSKNEKFAVYPFLHNRLHSLSQLGFLASCGVKTILLSEHPTGTFSYYSSSAHQAHSFTVELGQVRPFGENDMSRFEQAQQSLLALITNIEYQPEVSLNELDIYSVNQVVNKTKDDFELHFGDDTPNFTGFAKGTIMASENGKVYKAQVEGEAIVFPNAKVALGQRALLTVVPTQLEKFDV